MLSQTWWRHALYMSNVFSKISPHIIRRRQLLCSACTCCTHRHSRQMLFQSVDKPVPVSVPYPRTQDITKLTWTQNIVIGVIFILFLLIYTSITQIHQLILKLFSTKFERNNVFGVNLDKIYRKIMHFSFREVLFGSCHSTVQQNAQKFFSICMQNRVTQIL